MSAQPQFTPGPWNITMPNSDELEVCSDAIHGRSYPIAVVLTDDNEDCADAIPQANAALIAAAPELYEALSLCEAAITDHDPEPAEGTFWHKPLAKVRGALAKAVKP